MRRGRAERGERHFTLIRNVSFSGRPNVAILARDPTSFALENIVRLKMFCGCRSPMRGGANSLTAPPHPNPAGPPSPDYPLRAWSVHWARRAARRRPPFFRDDLKIRVSSHASSLRG
jgi:hypothetical protein